MSTTASALIKMSLQDLGVLGAGEAPRGEDLADGLHRLQMMLASWSLDPLTALQTDRLEFPITPGKGTYTIGPGMEFDTARPVGQQSVVGAGLVLENSTPPVEIPRSLLTYDAYQGIRVKSLTSEMFTSVFYQPGAVRLDPPTGPAPHGVASIEAGEIVLWPVPTVAHPLVLYIQQVVPLFDSLTLPYVMPAGVVAAIQYNLTLALAPMFQVTPSPDATRQARLTFAAMKRTNYQLADAPLDPMLTFGVGPGYDIYSGGTGGAGRG